MDLMTEPIVDDDIFEEDLEEQEQPKKGGKRKKNDGSCGYRKAPQAPKRFKSPYILFSMAKMEEYKNEQGGNAKVTSISRLVSEAWKKLPEEERKKWEDAAMKDKLRYNAEKSLYTGPWQVPSKRSRKDPSAPKRPMSAFLFFSQGMRQKLKAENPSMKNTEISCLLGERWKNAAEEERRPHVEREKMEREQYNKDIATWRTQRDIEEKAMRKRRQDIAEQFVESGLFHNGFQPQWISPQAGLPPIQVMMPPSGIGSGFNMATPCTGITYNGEVHYNATLTAQHQPSGQQQTSELSSQHVQYTNYPQHVNHQQQPPQFLPLQAFLDMNSMEAPEVNFHQ